MAKEILFVERQRFNQIWHLILIIAINGLLLFACYKQIIKGERFGMNSLSNIGLVVLTILCFIISVLILKFLILETKITNEGVFVRFYPFHRKFIHYPWKIISQAFITSYHPMREYGGWGLRYKPFKAAKAYNVSGNKGLQLVFVNGRKLLIGTQKEHELQGVLEIIPKQ
ncbi:MAG TPA: hypothetical protein VK616_07145 [Flavitalea sp.]|nr:hypothetical protein [Flavitalea sp.]